MRTGACKPVGFLALSLRSPRHRSQGGSRNTAGGRQPRARRSAWHRNEPHRFACSLIDLVTWAVRDAVRIDANLSDLADPYATLAMLGYGNAVEIRKLLNMADLEAEHPQNYP